jgi:AcrR family transcriptional regulator
MVQRPVRRTTPKDSGKTTGTYSRENGARARIVAAALKELVEGDGDFEIGDVARRAKVSVGLAYHYFGSKAGLISVLITEFHNRHEAVVNQSFAQSLPWPVREKARLKASIDFMYADPVAPVMMGKLSSSAEVIAIDTGRRSAVVEMAARNVAQGQRRGFIAADIDPDVAGAAIIGGVNQAVARAISSRQRPDPDQLADRLWSFIAGGLSLAQQAAPNENQKEMARCARSGSKRR